MAKKRYPYGVSVTLRRGDFGAVLEWLHLAGHEIRDTMKFTGNQYISGTDFITQEVRFIDRKQAIHFKLVWDRQW